MKAFYKVLTISVILLFIISLDFTYANCQVNFYADVPICSHRSGFYSGAIQITLTVSSPNAVIRYTLDSSDPDEASSIYTEPIDIQSTTVVRARAYQAGYHPSKIISHSFILNKTFQIPTLSLITDPSNLWGENGIHTHYDSSGDNWERPATIEFFESDGSLQFSSDIGLRIHGGTSRVFEKKSFRYFFRNEYGQGRLLYQLFKSKAIYELKRFVTSATFQDAPGNSAYGSGTLLRDAVLHEIGRRIEKDISLGARPVALFLVGKPWGIYNAIERIDKHFVEINFGIGDCDIVENYSHAIAGTIDRWNEMIDFFESSDLSLQQNYEKARSCVDIQNFTRYMLVEIYGGNMDWPDYNNFAFSGRSPGDKWRWLLWDLDNAFAYINANTFELATDDTIRGTIILRKLLENKDYRIYFLNECADFFNTVLQPENIQAIIDSLATIIRSDIAFETNRWGGTIEEWENSVQFLRHFADHRLERLWQYLIWELNVEDKHLLTIQAPVGGKGKVRINRIQINQYPWKGYYFKNIPIELEAIPNPGFKFLGWSDSLSSTENKVTLIMKGDYSVYPIFEPDRQNKTIIVINEINYNSATGFDPEDWVELYNPSDQIVYLSSWHLKDEDDLHDYKFPDSTMIEPLGFLILCRNQAAFHNLFPDVINSIGDFGFGLGGSGDAVRIYNFSYLLIDSVTYDDKLPWPLEADGNGATLELIDPALDNTLPQNWQASSGHGSPGKTNPNVQQNLIRQIKLKLIKGSLCNPDQGWDNAIDGDIQGSDGTVRADGNPCFAIFAFADENLCMINKFRLITDSGIGSSEYWVRKFVVEISETGLNPQDFVPVLNAEKMGGDWEEFSITPVCARYIKFNVIQPDSGWRQVAEFEAWGQDSSLVSAIEGALLNPASPNSDDRLHDNTQIIFSNFPNPFNERITISYQLTYPCHVQIKIYNITGQEIKKLVGDWKSPGIHQVWWDGRDEGKMIVPSGIYLLRVSSDKFNQTRKIILIK